MKKLLLTLWMSLLLAFAFAANLRDVPVTVVQPNGDTLHCFASGDEFYHYLHDANHFTIIQDKETGYFVYAIMSSGKIVPSSYVPGNVNPASVGILPGLRISAEEYPERRSRWEVPARFAERHNQRLTPPTRSFQRNHGNINNIVIFITFADDASFSSRNYSYVNNMFNNEDSGTVSMKKYFKEASYNQLEINTFFYPAPSEIPLFHIKTFIIEIIFALILLQIQ